MSRWRRSGKRGASARRARPDIMGAVLGIVYRVIATHLIGKAGFGAKRAHTGAVRLIQRFGSALNLMKQPQYPRCASD